MTTGKTENMSKTTLCFAVFIAFFIGFLCIMIFHQSEYNSDHLEFPLNYSDHLQCPVDYENSLALYEERIKGRVVHHNLPSPPTPFSGRERELEEITSLIHNDKKDIISIHGPPAFGKSALAVHVGYSMLHLGIDVKYIDTSETPLLLQRMISFELVSFNPCDRTSNLVEWVRTLKHSTLLILDNLDNDLAQDTEAFHDLIVTLVKIAPLHTLKILMTSQTHITFLDRFQQFFVGSLDQRAAVDLLDELTNVPVTDSHRLVQLVGFCPLTIKVVASLLNKPGMEDSAWLLAVLKNNTISTSCLDEKLPMNRCWKAVMDVAYKRLGEEGQICGHIVSFFPGSFDDSAAKSILPKPDCPKLLVFTSLVERYTYNSVIRYIMHKLVKAYFQNRTFIIQQKDAQERFENKFQSYYLTLAYSKVQQFSKTESTHVEELYYRFSIESHNWKELVRKALPKSAGGTSDVLVLSVAFIHYRNLLPSDVSWPKLFHTYNTQSFDNVCQILGNISCSEILLETIKNVQETLPLALVSCSLLAANHGLLSQIKHYVPSSQCYCETHTNLLHYFVHIPYICLLVVSVIDLCAIHLSKVCNIDINRYLCFSKLFKQRIYKYYMSICFFLLLFLHHLTLILCYAEQHITSISVKHWFICIVHIVYIARCIRTSREVLQNKRVELCNQTVYYNTWCTILISTIVLFISVFLSYYTYIHTYIPTYLHTYIHTYIHHNYTFLIDLACYFTSVFVLYYVEVFLNVRVTTFYDEFQIYVTLLVCVVPITFELFIMLGLAMAHICGCF